MSAFGHLFRDVVYATYLVSEGGQDPDGNPIPPEWADPIPVRCRLEDKQVLIRNKSGQEIASKTQLITDVPVESHWRFWLPGADTSKLDQAEEPEAVGSAGSLDGRTRLWEVWF